MNTSNLTKPIKKGNWLIWHDTAFDIMDNIDCNDTVSGVCLTNKSLDQCIDECKNSCGAGYHISMPDKTSICVPVRTDIHPNLNPVYRLRRKEQISELKNIKISSFINTDFFSFPPENSNLIFYNDIVVLKNNKTNLSLSTKNIEDNTKGIYMKNNAEDSITIVSSKISASNIINYQPILYGDKIQISIPGTNLLAKQKKYGTRLIWKTTDKFLSDTFFTIIPVSDKKLGDPISYNDKFKIQYSDISLVTLNDNNYLELIYSKSDENNTLFKFESKMIGYYCDNNICKSVPINKIKSQHQDKFGTYKGIPVRRIPGCWGLCSNNIQYSNKNTNKINWTIIVIVIIILIITSIIILKS